jgi:hypothetical protein
LIAKRGWLCRQLAACRQKRPGQGA